MKAAPKRRRGGKHRHKGLTAEATAEAPAEAGVSGTEDASAAWSAADHALPDGALSDNLARLQLDRLASNAAAGTFISCLLLHAYKHQTSACIGSQSSRTCTSTLHFQSICQHAHIHVANCDFVCLC